MALTGMSRTPSEKKANKLHRPLASLGLKEYAD